jgi:hypothetical protein
MNLSTPEICVCAAIKLADGQVITGRRHHHCLAVMEATDLPKRGSILGFSTNWGNFVDRQEGLKLQLAAAVPSAWPTGYMPGGLTSEDLY